MLSKLERSSEPQGKPEEAPEEAPEGEEPTDIHDDECAYEGEEEENGDEDEIVQTESQA